jgi:hypothetical protein
MIFYPQISFDTSNTLYPSVTTLLAHAKIIDFSVVREDIRQRSMKRGTSVHWTCQLYDEGALNRRTVPKALRGYLKAWITWRERSGFVPMLIERPFISPYGYAGTPDRVGHFNLTLDKIQFSAKVAALIDLKTGEGPILDATRLQLAAYVDYYRPAWGALRRVAVKLHADGTYHAKEFPQTSYAIDRAKLFKALTDWKEAKDADRNAAGQRAVITD